MPKELAGYKTTPGRHQRAQGGGVSPLGASWGDLGGLLGRSWPDLGAQEVPKGSPRRAQIESKTTSFLLIDLCCDFDAIWMRFRGHARKERTAGTSRSARSGRPLASCFASCRVFYLRQERCDESFCQGIYNTLPVAAQGAADRFAHSAGRTC